MKRCRKLCVHAVAASMLVLGVSATAWGGDLLSPQAAQTLMAEKSDEALFVLDVRTQSEHAQAHIPGTDALADWYKWPRSFETISDRIPDGAAVLVYCASGGRSARATAWLEANGVSQVYDLEGGMTAWQAAELPTAP